MSAELTKPVAVSRSSKILKYVMAIVIIIIITSVCVYAFVYHILPHLYIVTTGSMIPTLKPGDLVIIQHVDPSKIKVGDIVAFNVVVYDLDNPVPVNLGITVIHRVVNIIRYGNVTYLITKGDNNPVTDPWYVPENYVLGIVHKVASLGKLGLILASPQGHAVIAGLAVLCIMFLWLIIENRRSGQRIVV